MYHNGYKEYLKIKQKWLFIASEDDTWKFQYTIFFKGTPAIELQLNFH